MMDETPIEIYEEAITQARNTHMETMTQVWKIYGQDMDKARKPYAEAVALAVKTRQKAKEQAWKIYHEAKVKAKQTLEETEEQ